MADIGKREMNFFEYLDKEKSIFRWNKKKFLVIFFKTFHLVKKRKILETSFNIEMHVWIADFKQENRRKCLKAYRHEKVVYMFHIAWIHICSIAISEDFWIA